MHWPCMPRSRSTPLFISPVPTVPPPPCVPTAPAPFLPRSDTYLEEGTGCNVFVVHGRTLSTPPAAGSILPGITRASVLALAAALGHTTREAQITAEEAMQVTCPTACLPPGLMRGGGASQVGGLGWGGLGGEGWTAAGVDGWVLGLQTSTSEGCGDMGAWLLEGAGAGACAPIAQQGWSLCQQCSPACGMLCEQRNVQGRIGPSPHASCHTLVPMPIVARTHTQT